MEITPCVNVLILIDDTDLFLMKEEKLCDLIQNC